MNDADMEILQHMMNGGKPPDFAVRLLEDICERTGLSWKARHVYLQKRRNKSGADTWQAVLSIDGFRAVGSGNPEYAGQEGPFWVTTSDGTWSDLPPEGKPYAAKVGIRKRDGITTWGVAKYQEYAVTGGGGMMWDKFSTTMIAKCAEMLAWRKTLPRVFGGLYGDAEMDQTGPVQPSTPKELLKKAEVVGEISDPGKGTQARDTLRQTYVDELENANNRVDVVGIGRRIQGDKALDPADTFALHRLYTDKMKKYQ